MLLSLLQSCLNPLESEKHILTHFIVSIGLEEFQITAQRELAVTWLKLFYRASKSPIEMSMGIFRWVKKPWIIDNNFDERKLLNFDQSETNDNLVERIT